MLLLDKNKLTHLPPEIYQLSGSIRKLSLTGNPIPMLNMHIYENCQHWTTKIDLSHSLVINDSANGMTSFVLHNEVFAGLSQLKQLCLNDNEISLLPSSVSELVSLEILELQNNQLNVLPWQLGMLTSLKKLKLGGNPLARIPLDVRRQKNNLPSLLHYLLSLKETTEECYRYTIALTTHTHTHTHKSTPQQQRSPLLSSR